MTATVIEEFAVNRFAMTNPAVPPLHRVARVRISDRIVCEKEWMGNSPNDNIIKRLIS